MDMDNPVWAQPPQTQLCPSSKKETWVQVKIPSIRANGLPSKRATLALSRAPKQRHLASEWTWRNSAVRVVTIPCDSRTQFMDTGTQYFLAAYIPSKFTHGQVVWGDRLWFQFDTQVLSNWLPEEVSITDPDIWFHDFLTNPMTLRE